MCQFFCIRFIEEIFNICSGVLRYTIILDDRIIAHNLIEPKLTNSEFSR